ncbi:MAG TPA: hypothetical protein VMM78_08990 [Thermomicrobiales bacterium]|nr:hypothetical protein [Thermomicrobiales bacterium]
MDEKYENPRLRALLLGARNQLDWLWKLPDQQGSIHSARVEGVLKLIGAIDYALGIEPYTLDLDLSLDEAGKAVPAQATGEVPQNGVAWHADSEPQPVSHPLDVGGPSHD